MRKTKVVCTIGPASSDLKVLKEMILSGMSVARLNMSHGEHSSHQEIIDKIKSLRDKLSMPVAIMVDTKGPEIRIKKFEKNKVVLEKNKLFTLTTSDVLGNDKVVSVTYKNLPKELKEGDQILLNDGFIELSVLSVSKYDIVTKVVQGGELSNNKSINLPGKFIKMPYLGETDKKDLLFAIENDVEYVAISFVQNEKNVNEVREFIENNGGKNIKIISKIENSEGVKNIEAITKVSDGVMVARGDLGVEVDFKKIPTYQKMIIDIANTYGKISITATQMLESMINNSRPTRAEISDVANAVLDGSSAVMLSGETAVGKFVVETIKTMCSIVEECETNFASRINTNNLNIEIDDVSEDVAYACCSLASKTNIKAIISLTISGKSATELSEFKPKTNIIAMTCNEKSFHQLAMNFGIKPVYIDFVDGTIDELIKVAIKKCKQLKFIYSGDTVIVTASLPFGASKSTNLLKIEKI